MYYPWERAVNSANSYDQVGFFYNLSSTLALRSIGNNIYNILPISATAIKNRYEDVDFNYQDFINDFPWDVSETIKNNLEDSFENFIAELSVSTATKSKISELVTAVNSFESMGDNYDSIKEVIVSIETEIAEIHEQGLISEIEFNQLYCMSSTIRYATLFYNEHIPTPNDLSTAKKKGFFWKIFGAIACAAIYAFALGPAIFGGPLSILGAISFGLVGFATGWYGVQWGLNGFNLD